MARETPANYVPFSHHDACWCQPFDVPPHPNCPMHGTKFVAVHETIMLAHQVVGRMISKTMAKRAANALNRHKPNKEGV